LPIQLLGNPMMDREQHTRGAEASESLAPSRQGNGATT
jgi:hypothetical protein